MSERRFTAANLREAFESAERWLAENRDGINAINVYPVPDGDTGTNMLLTWRAALRGVDEAGDETDSVGSLTEVMARAALLGARGNSGVILSQMIRGLAEALDGHDDAGSVELAQALKNASDVAYAAVSRPVEGTMLTVLREACTIAHEQMAAEIEAERLLRDMVAEAYASVQRTPDLLPRLREAGVVDAGGAGIAVLLEGVVAHLFDIPLPPEPRYAATEHVETGSLEHEGHGYCTEFIVLGQQIDLRALEQALIDAGGDSLLVVGDARTAHIHVHLEDPGPALSIGAAAGALDSVKIENMQAQHEAWMAGQAPGTSRHATVRVGVEAQPLGLVAITRGSGIAAAFRDLGAGAVIELEGSTKASAGEILEAAHRAGIEHAFVLPNDGDILMAAEAAALESAGFLTVIPSANVAAGLTSAVAYLPHGDAAAVAEEMTAALDEVRCVEVSTAVRDATVDGVDVRAGDAIVLIDGRMHAAAETHEEALLAGVAAAMSDAAGLVTVYLGLDTEPSVVARVLALIEAAHPGVEVEAIPGGQPHYPYIAGVE